MWLGEHSPGTYWDLGTITFVHSQISAPPPLPASATDRSWQLREEVLFPGKLCLAGRHLGGAEAATQSCSHMHAFMAVPFKKKLFTST